MRVLQFLRDKLELSAKNVRMFRPLALIFSLVSLAPALFATQLDPSYHLYNKRPRSEADAPPERRKSGNLSGFHIQVRTGRFWGRMAIPLGYLAVAKKIGDHAPVGAVFHNRRFTGEILSPNAPGRDPVITRSFGCVAWKVKTLTLLVAAFLHSWHAGREDDRPPQPATAASG